MSKYIVRMRGDFRFEVSMRKKFLFIPYWKVINTFRLYKDAENYVKGISGGSKSRD